MFLDIDWTRDLQVGEYVIVECYRKLSPVTITLTGTLTSNTSANTVTGYGTKFDQEILENDFITIGGEDKQVYRITSPTTLELQSPVSSNVDNVSVTSSGYSDVWDDRFLKRYATALIKYQWGSNLSKFAGIQMPGGVTLDGPRIMEEARTEIDKIEEEMQVYNVLPNEIYMG